MKKKIRPNLKFKKRYLLDSGRFYWLLRKQYLPNQNSMNLMSFIKKFKYFSTRPVYPIMAILGFRINTKLFVLKKVRRPGRVIQKIMAKSFYKNYSIEKNKTFKVLENLFTFRSFRFHFSFPLNGQKTRTHAKTRKKYSII